MTGPRLYDELAPWYTLLTPKEEYAEEAAMYGDALARAAPDAETLLELGCGAGHNAYHLKARYRCTLTDLAPSMLALSEALNPECAHHLGDMRALRLTERFDLVLVHDAVMYMRSEDDLRRAMETAHAHLHPGGAALFVPDFVKETFVESTQVFEAEDEGRAMRCVEWDWDPDPDDDTFVGDYVFVLREGRGEVRVVHDRHVVGCFSRETWLRLLREVGFQPELLIHANEPPYEAQELFLAKRLG